MRIEIHMISLCNSQFEENNPKSVLIEHCKIGEYWLGTNQLHRLTTHKSYRFCVELKHWDTALAYAEVQRLLCRPRRERLSADG